jgi:protein-S-isoprenylcysteine O-methyltransferase Ste14
MFILIRALAYAVLIVGIVLVLLPAEFQSSWGLTRPAAIHLPQIVGIAVALGGAGIALWCVVTFAFVGGGTPVPFDPPRRLVQTGPYQLVRNPMAIGVALALAGTALFYQSIELLVFTGLFLLVIHLMVVWYEEPTLRRMFGDEYEAYSRRVRRWWPWPRA